MPYFFLFQSFSILGLSIVSAVWAFHVYSCLSGYGMPYFFFGLKIFCFGDTEGSCLMRISLLKISLLRIS